MPYHPEHNGPLSDRTWKLSELALYVRVGTGQTPRRVPWFVTEVGPDDLDISHFNAIG